MAIPLLPQPSVPAEGVAADASQQLCGPVDVPVLTAALRRGEEWAFRRFHAEWNSRLYRYGLALTGGDEVRAAEVAQAVYLRILRHMRPLPDEPALWNWIARAARNAWSDQARVSGRYRNALARFRTWLLSPPGSAIPPAPQDCPDPLASLDRAMSQLSPDDRQLLEARYGGNQTLESIGEMMGCSARAVEGRLARLRRRLRRILTSGTTDPGTD